MKLSSFRRNHLASSTFALPDERKYPIPDSSHAANAKARAKQQFNKGNITRGQMMEIFSKADKKLGK